MYDYPDNSENPNYVFLSIEELIPQIELIQGFKKYNDLDEIQYLINETIDVITVNSNYHDNALDYISTYAQDIRNKEDEYTFEIYSEFIYKLCEVVVRKLKELHLYSLDDVCYYRFHKSHSLTLFSLMKVHPLTYWEVAEEPKNIMGLTNK